MGLVTTFCPLTMTGSGETVLQAYAPRLGEDCKVKPGAFVDHDKITFVPAFWIFNANPRIVMLLISKLFAVSLSPLEASQYNRQLIQLIGKLLLSVPDCV